MIYNRKLDLQLFADGGDAGDSEAEGGSTADVQIGDTLEDGTIVDENLASSMRENADMYPTRNRAAFAQGQQGQGNESQQAGGQEPGETTEAQQWAEAKKKFAKFYGADVKDAVNDRFKNQADANKRLDALQPMIQALMKKTGAETEEELSKLITEDDSLYEEEAEAMGMTVEAYRKYRKMETEHDEAIAMRQREEERQRNSEHIEGLFRQAEELKQLFPDFDLQKELQNEQFFRYTAPGGMSVKEAYYAIHGDELIPQLMAYGVQQGKDQISKSLQANAARPVEGASRRGAVGGGVQPGNDKMTEEMYDRIRNRTMRGENVPL